MADYSRRIRSLTEGSIWIDSAKRTIVVWRIHWANAENVASFDLLAIPGMKIKNFEAKDVENYVRTGELQYCQDCERE